MDFSNIYIRAIRKIGILNYFNFFKEIQYGKQKVSIPIINGIGYPNLFIKPDWLYLLINEIFDHDGDTFIDVGANIGQTLIAVKSADKKINYIGFEPSSSCTYYLTVLRNRNRFSDCYVYNFALSDKLKENIFETNVDADPTASLVQNLRPRFFKNRDSIFSLAYDLLDLTNEVTCIKIDIEGGELEALQGMKGLVAKYRPYIICEILDSFSDDVSDFTQERADKVCHYLNEAGYLIFQLVQKEETNQILSFNEIEAVTIVQWKRESLMLNDYFFFPSEKKHLAKQMLQKLIN